MSTSVQASQSRNASVTMALLEVPVAHCESAQSPDVMPSARDRPLSYSSPRADIGGEQPRNSNSKDLLCDARNRSAILQGRRNGQKDGASLREARKGEAGEDFLEGRSLSAASPKQVQAIIVRAPLLTKKRGEGQKLAITSPSE